MRVAHLTATFPPYWGGTGTVAFEQARELARRGHDVSVLTGTAGEPGDDPDGVDVERIAPRVAIGNAPLLPRLAERMHGFDVVHFHHPFIFGGEAVLRSARRPGAAAVVVTYHNRLIGDGARRPLFFAYEESVVRAVVRAADRVCVVSREHASSVASLRSGMRKRPERFAVVPNGVDVDRFSPGPGAAVRDRIGVPHEARVVVVTAALDRAHHFKRIDLAIDAVARLTGEVHLLVIGGGELLGGLRERAATSGVGDRVHFAGPQPYFELEKWLRAGDVALLPSDPPESFGLALIEAMACGLPVVATDFPGARAVVPDHAGLIARRGDPADVAAKLAQILEAPSGERDRLREAARRHAAENHSWASIVDRLEQIYRDALDRRRTPATSR